MDFHFCINWRTTTFAYSPTLSYSILECIIVIILQLEYQLKINHKLDYCKSLCLVVSQLGLYNKMNLFTFHLPKHGLSNRETNVSRSAIGNVGGENTIKYGLLAGG